MNRNKPYILSADEALQLADLYFEAATTEEQEEALKHYIVAQAADDRRFDELRAIMGLAAYARKVQSEAFKPHAASHVRHHRRTVAMRWAAAIAIIFAASTVVGTLTYQHNNQCIAYIGGQKVTDTELVMQAMHASIDNVGAPTDTPSVEAQIGDMLNTIE